MRLSLPSRFSGVFSLNASIHSGAKGSNSSIRRLGQVGSFSSVSNNHSAGLMPFSLAVPSKDCIAAARFPARSEPANNQFFFQVR